ncbi:MAG: FIST N-terminal domain-containing protein [Candidatus Levyibacteriota bacterium]
MAKEEPQLLNVQKAAAFLGINPSTIRQWATSRKLKGVKVGSRGDWRFTREELSKMIKKHTSYKSTTPPRLNRDLSEKTQSTVVYTNIPESKKAGKDIGEQILSVFDTMTPDVVILFVSSKYNYSELLGAVKKYARPKIMVGCSSAGEFITKTKGEGSVSAIAIRSDDMQFSVGIGKNIHNNAEQAAKDAIASFQGLKDHTYPYRSALVLVDALAGHTDTLIEAMNNLTAGTYQFFGGGAGDDAKFSKTHVFFDTEAITDAVVTLEMLSKKPFGIGVAHGWETASKPMRVTESDGMRLISLNAMSAVEVFKEHAKATGQTFDLSDPVPFFLHNVIGIKTTNGYKLRVPLAINKDGSINCASDIPTGAIVSIMKTTAASAALAAKEATEDALAQITGNEKNVAIVFDCVATRLRTGREFATELDAVAEELGGTQYVGCNTYGQIARVDGQFNGFHNCTAVVCIIPQ